MQKTILWFVLAMTLGASKTIAQELQANIERVSGIYARHYVQPAVNAFGGGFNTGLFHASTVENGWMGPRGYLGIRAFGTIMPEIDRTFSARFEDQIQLNIESTNGTSTQLYVPATFEVDQAPTIFGTDEPGVIQVSIRQDIAIPNQEGGEIVSIDTSFSQQTFGGLYHTDIGPGAIPHIEVGTVFGTDLMFRWLPRLSVDEVGSATFHGFGIRHNLSPYLRLPFDLTVQGAVQEAKLLDAESATFATARLRAFNITFSSRSDNARIFARLQTEQAEVNIRYTYDPALLLDEDELGSGVAFEPVAVNLDLDSRINHRFTVGFCFAMGPLNLSAGYSFGSRDVLSISAGMLLGAQ